MARLYSTPALVCFALVAAGCIGNIGAPGGPGAGADGDPVVGGASPDGPNGSNEGVGTSTSALCATTHEVGAAHFEHLTRDEYVHAVRDLTGVTVQSDSLPGDDTTQGFSLGVTSSPLLADAYATSAEAIAARADVLALSGCQSAAPDECATSFVHKLARRAFRRPLTSDEQAGLSGVFAAGKGDGLAAGIKLALEAVLASPSFLYHVDQTDAPDATGLAPLTAHALASRLAFMVWGSLPDTELLDAADAGELSNPAQVSAAVTRMIRTQPERARAGFQRFYREWLWLDQLDTLTRDGSLYPAFSSALVADLRASFERQVDEAVWAEGAPLTDVLRGSTGFANGALAPLFGVSASGTELSAVALPEDQRYGLLTHPALLSVLAKPNQSAPVIRGKFVREQLLCQKLPPPPPDVATVAPDPSPGLTTRERFAEHSRDPSCAGCHSLMDPIGFGLKHFDALGQFRALDEGKPVDARGQIAGSSDAAGAFDGAVGLAERLADSEDVRDCIATQYFRFAVRRTEASDDACSLSAAQASLASGARDLKTLIAAVANSDAFRYRTP